MCSTLHNYWWALKVRGGSYFGNTFLWFLKSSNRPFFFIFIHNGTTDAGLDTGTVAKRVSNIGDNWSLMLLLPAIYYHRCHGIDENLEQSLISSVNDTGDNLLPVTTTPAIIYRLYRWHRWTAYTNLRISPGIFLKFWNSPKKMPRG